MLACDAAAPRHIPRTRRPPKPRTLRAIRPSLAIEDRYQAALDAQLAAMQASLDRWLIAAYRANEPEIAQDISPAAALQRAFAALARRWQRRFDDLAPKLAKWFATATHERSDAALKGALKDAGFTVKFNSTVTTNDVFRATINENVGLIKSIASEHLTDVQGLVMRSVQTGRDIGGLREALQDRYDITKRRATTIARDQNSKATSAIVRVRQQELGCTQALWMHSGAGRHPRPSHVAMSGKPYEIAKGVRLDGEIVWPGTAIKCRCTSKTIIPGLED
jgi:SPP1 gp7 family putative phage head morphogenesis protein